MIRRDATLADGTPAWVLISQVEHARLAGDLARAWGSAAFPAPEFSADVIGAIDHHDDGWADWEVQPEIDPASGRPLEFVEMPQAAALEIWRGSIESAARLGPLPGWMVAGHFSLLLRGASPATVPVKRPSRRLNAPALAWLEEFDVLREGWFLRWEVANPARHTLAAAETALAQLRFFDALSLWFCCAERTETQRLDTPASDKITLTPQSPAEIRVQPWPFSTETVEIRAAGTTVAARQYESAEALAQAPHEAVELAWQLRA